MARQSQAERRWNLQESLRKHGKDNWDEISRWTGQTCELQHFDGEKSVPLFMTPTPAVLRGRARWQRCSFIWNSRCDQGLIVSYSLASKSGEMLTSRDVRASVPKYMPSVPKYIFRDTSHYQLLLFVEETSPALDWCTLFVSRGLPTVHEWWWSAIGWRRTGVPLFMVSQNGCRTLDGVKLV